MSYNISLSIYHTTVIRLIKHVSREDRLAAYVFQLALEMHGHATAYCCSNCGFDSHLSTDPNRHWWLTIVRRPQCIFIHLHQINFLCIDLLKSSHIFTLFFVMYQQDGTKYYRHPPVYHLPEQDEFVIHLSMVGVCHLPEHGLGLSFTWT